MKLRILGVLTLALLVLPVALAEWAGKTVHVTVPFDFYVGDTMMPAGDYQMNHHAQSGTCEMFDKDGHRAVMHVQHEKSPSGEVEKTHLSFLKEGSRYTLHMVQVAGDRDLHNMVHSKEIADITVVEAK